MTGLRLSIRCALSELRPTPQRLRWLVAAFADWGYEQIYLDWSDSFPWTLDDRFRGNDAYDEELVAGLFDEAQGRGIELNALFPAPDSLDFVAHVPVYARLFRGVRGHRVLDLGLASARKLYADLIDDFLGLLPHVRSVLIDFRPAFLSAVPLVESVRGFRERGVRLAVQYRGPADRFAADSAELLEGFDAVATPFEQPGAGDEAQGDRIIHAMPMTTPAQRESAYEALRPLEAEAMRTLLLSFQPDARGPSAQPAGAILSESIEGVLEQIRSAAERLSVSGRKRNAVPASSAGVCRSAIALDGQLAAALDEGWQLVRRARELLVGGRALIAAAGVLEALAGSYGAAVSVARELREQLSELIDPARLDRSLYCLLAALYDEYLSVCGRAGVSAAVLAPDDGMLSGAP